jgi:hypothetical protein
VIRVVVAAALCALLGCRRSFPASEQRFVTNVQAALAAGDGRDGELALSLCSEARRTKHPKAPLIRIAPGRFRDCAGQDAPPAVVKTLASTRVVLAWCPSSGEELLVRDDLSVFARWPDDGLDALACVGKCRAAGCAPPCSESALAVSAGLCGSLPVWDGALAPVRLEQPWPTLD